ncbi:MAG: NAD(P)-dependent oxidoreductase [Chloroflexi bacterium]|nr:NAD(P)-dependent oxidoreductase [Chloroflexota bacterium]
MPLTKAGLAGLGPRAKALAVRLRMAGLRVIGYDADVQVAATSGLRTVGSPQRLAEECELEVVAMDGEAAAETIERLLDVPGGLAHLEAIALCGTLEPRRVQELTAAAAAKGVALLDAPIDGSDEAIAGGRAVVFASGNAAAVELCRPALQAFGTVVHVGEAGSGQIARTVNDLLRWANVLAIHDAFSLARACGADPSPIRDAVLHASGSNRALQEWGRGGLEAARADIQAALILAQETGAAMPFLQQLDGLLARLDPAQMDGLFNLGIVDLTKRSEGA